MKDDEVTWVLTNGNILCLPWILGSTKKTIAHSENCLPELETQAGLAILLDFAREWDQFQEIPYLILTFAYI